MKRGMALLLLCAMLLALMPAASSAEAAANETNAGFSGYLFGVTEKRDAGALHRRAAQTDGIDVVDYAENCFTAERLEQIYDFVPAQDIAYVEPNYLVHTTETELRSATVPDDPYYEEYQWNVDALNAAAAWECGIEAQDMDDTVDMDGDGIADNDPIVIAVIDSGLKQGHEDIDFDRVLEGKNFLTTGGSTEDTLGHGTFVTGQVMATKDNGLGVAGLCQSVFVVPLKVFQSRTTSTDVIVSAISYATEQKTAYDATDGTEGMNICVINMSLGSEGSSTALKTACEAAIDAGIIVVCSAGNDGDTTASYPAQYAIGVGSTDADGGISYYSQVLSAANGAGYENKVWVSAPGADIVSTYCSSTSSYYKGSGTSFSAPEVSALAAIVKSLDNTIDHEGFKQLLRTTAVPQGDTAEDAAVQDANFGWGTVDFGRTIQAVLGDLTERAVVKIQVLRADQQTPENVVTEVYELEEDAAGNAIRGARILPEEDGSYILSQGRRYWYAATASRCENQSGIFAVVGTHRTLTIVLDGATYYTAFQVFNSDGEEISDAEITLKNEAKRAVLQITDQDDPHCGAYGTRNGTYTYTVSAQGYFPTEGSFTVNDLEQPDLENGNRVTVMLYGAQDIYDLSLRAADGDGSDLTADTVWSIYDAQGSKVTPYLDGNYKLRPGSYTYTAENKNYKAVSDEIVVTEEQTGSAGTVQTIFTNRIYWAFMDVMPLTVMADIQVWDSSGALQPAAGLYGEYRLVNGDYTYSVSAEGYNTYLGSFTVQGKIVYVDIQMEEGDDVIGSLPCTHSRTELRDAAAPGCTTPGSTGDRYCLDCGALVEQGEELAPLGHELDEGEITVSPGIYLDGELCRTCLRCGATITQTIPAAQHCDPETCPGTAFADMPDVDHWAHAGLDFALERGLLVGVSDTAIAPEDTMTRAMLVTVLWRLAGEPEAEASGFTDVPAGAWYAAPVAWAAEQCIVVGTGDGCFSPDGAITREQFATMLYRYAAASGLSTAVYGDTANHAFADYAAVSAFADTAVTWAYENGLMGGYPDGTLRPRAAITRAEAAAMMMRLVQTLA